MLASRRAGRPLPSAGRNPATQTTYGLPLASHGPERDPTHAAFHPTTRSTGIATASSDPLPLGQRSGVPSHHCITATCRRFQGWHRRHLAAAIMA